MKSLLTPVVDKQPYIRDYWTQYETFIHRKTIEVHGVDFTVCSRKETNRPRQTNFYLFNTAEKTGYLSGLYKYRNRFTGELVYKFFVKQKFKEDRTPYLLLPDQGINIIPEKDYQERFTDLLRSNSTVKISC